MDNQKIVLNTIEEALEDFRQGKFVIVKMKVTLL